MARTQTTAAKTVRKYGVVVTYLFHIETMGVDLSKLGR
jgi:hypothetical protein